MIEEINNVEKDNLVIEKVDLDKETFSTEEVCSILNEKKEIIYFWTNQFKEICNLKIILDKKKRVYFKHDIEILFRIKELYYQDKTISEIKKIFENEKIISDNNIQIKNNLIKELKGEIIKDLDDKLSAFKHELIKEISLSMEKENTKHINSINENIDKRVRNSVREEFDDVISSVEDKMDKTIENILDENKSIKGEIENMKSILDKADKRDVEVLELIKSKINKNQEQKQEEIEIEDNKKTFVGRIKNLFIKKY